MKVTALTRAFTYAGVSLPDPNPNLSPDQVRDVFSATYPELATASVEGPETRDGKLLYTFRRAAGTKGGTVANTATDYFVRQANQLSERVCMGCLLPDCNEKNWLCLRSIVTEKRVAPMMVERALEAIDVRLNDKACDTMAMRVLCDARDRIRQACGKPGHA